ncbi:Vacuolar protein sorting-associated protein 52 [Batrachochytrium dendrobatidis]|nr:Vacuolar protein sorting-associated protein 52 [Batrachochytrium dendrobatidis]KAK5668748.1 Vacuolar protein sorting-associated protein 52 [Batrachochytrium dendrobatidis]
MADSLKVVTRVSTVSDSSRLSAHDKDAIPNSLQGVISKLLQDAESTVTDEAAWQTKPRQSVVASNKPEYDITFDEVDDRITEFQEDELVKSALSKGVNLREYAMQIEKDLTLVQDAHVLDYIRQVHSLIDLHGQIKECDLLLGNMETLLRGNQMHLGQINDEISVMQEQSRSMTIRLRNRVSTQSSLFEMLEGTVVSPDLIKKICEGEVNEFFLQHLIDLDKKMTYVKSRQEKKIRSFKDVAPELERLRQRAVEKIRDFLLKKIESLKSPNTNIAIIQQSVFLKYRSMFSFLMERYSEVGVEIHGNYVATVSNYYFVLFEKYVKSIAKFQMVIADKFDLIGCEEGAKRGLFSGRLTLKDKTNVFTLGDRLQVLVNPDPGIIMLNIAEDSHLKYSYEAIFKSTTRLLLDNACSEYIFTTEFFSKTNTSHPIEVPGVVFTEIFDQTLKMLQATIKAQIDNTFDAVGILICIRINSQNIRIMQKRRIPCLETFLNLINILLWPRFQAIIDMHIDSLRRAAVNRLLVTKEVHPHYIMRRYVEFSAAILTLNQGYDDALLTNSLARLRSEVEVLIQRMAMEFPSRKNRSVFFINNFDLVASILNEYTTASFNHEKEYFDRIVIDHTAEFVDNELDQYIHDMVELVQKYETVDNLSFVDAEKFEQVATDFNATWKSTINNMYISITQAFPNFQNGARILHTAMTQFLLFYRRFLTCFERRFSQGKKSRVQPVGIQSLMVEIKKFKSSFQ